MDRTLWLIECAHKGDKKARETAVQENMGLVRNVVKRYQGRGVEQEDLIQIGCIGLLKAIDLCCANDYGRDPAVPER